MSGGGFDLFKPDSYHNITDGIGNAAGLSHPANPAAQRGSPRGGQGPDANNYNLGNDPDYLEKFANGQGQINAQAQGVGQQAQALGQTASGLSASGTAAQQRGAPATNYGAANVSQTAANVAGGQQGQAVDWLNKFANGPAAPSAAQAQLASGNDAALNSSIATARSGTGFGESATAMSQAGQQSAQTLAQNANAAATLRANETVADRAQRLQAVGQGADVLANQRNQYLQTGAQQGAESEFVTNSRQQQIAQNDQHQQALEQLALGNNQTSLEGQNQAINAQNQSNQLALQAAQAQQTGTMGYEQAKTDIYGIDNSAHQATRQADQAAGQAGLGAVGGLVSSLGSAAMMMSDRRSKRRIRDAQLSETYSALSD